MLAGPSFEEYLISKKIDSQRFQQAEPEIWRSWKTEFEQMHPNSFTVQKLNLINPVRRKYQLQANPDENNSSQPGTPAGSPRPGKPVIKPRS